ncbi:hypothetical protein [Brucella melitensis]|uniref:hypothetical protein n=1 Tax=Brucella melitensis TaxID=29459 RepID=UPI0032C17ADE
MESKIIKSLLLAVEHYELMADTSRPQLSNDLGFNVTAIRSRYQYDDKVGYQLTQAIDVMAHSLQTLSSMELRDPRWVIHAVKDLANKEVIRNG